MILWHSWCTIIKIREHNLAIAWYVNFAVVSCTHLWLHTEPPFICQRDMAAIFALWICSFIYYVLILRAWKLSQSFILPLQSALKYSFAVAGFSDIAVKVMCTRPRSNSPRDFVVRLLSYYKVYVINKYVFGEHISSIIFILNFINFCWGIVLVLTW
jgi:hypothetical protein